MATTSVSNSVSSEYTLKNLALKMGPRSLMGRHVQQLERAPKNALILSALFGTIALLCLYQVSVLPSTQHLYLQCTLRTTGALFTIVSVGTGVLAVFKGVKRHQAATQKLSVQERDEWIKNNDFYVVAELDKESQLQEQMINRMVVLEEMKATARSILTDPLDDQSTLMVSKDTEETAG